MYQKEGRKEGGCHLTEPPSAVLAAIRVCGGGVGRKEGGKQNQANGVVSLRRRRRRLAGRRVIHPRLFFLYFSFFFEEINVGLGWAKAVQEAGDEKRSSTRRGHVSAPNPMATSSLRSRRGGGLTPNQTQG
jgi:hypothetical protein